MSSPPSCPLAPAPHDLGILSRLVAAIQLPASTEAASKYAESRFSTEQGALEVYEGLEERISSPEYEQTLAAAFREEETEHSAELRTPAMALEESFWDAPQSSSPQPSSSSFSEEDSDGFVLVAKDDVLDSMADFIARYLATVPEARSLPPAKLQTALAGTLRELRGKGILRRIFDWGRIVYRTTALTAGAWSLYNNPWLARAVVSAVYATGKTVMSAGMAALPVVLA
ncbi:MADS box interactor-like [Pycnococcus provasolii]